MEQKVGISLCIRGSAARVAGSRLCRISRGTAMIVSPAMPVVDMELSDDFEECIVTEQMGLVAEQTASFFPHMIPLAPCVRLEDKMVEHITEVARRIRERENLQPQSEIFMQMNRRVITLMRLGLILETLYEIAAGAPTSESTPSRGEQVFARFIQSLVRDTAKRKTVADYAAEAALSVRHFSLLIHRYTGQTPKQWITAITIGRAKSMLMQPDIRIKEIADRLGFPEQFTFRKYFKKNTGLSPTRYRAENDTLSAKKDFVIPAK